MICLLTGNDDYRISAATAARIISHATTDVTIVDGREPAARDALLQCIAYPSLFPQKRVMVIRNSGALSTLAALLKEHATPGDSDLLLILTHYTGGKPSADIRKALAAITRQADDHIVCDLLSGKSLTEWIRSFCSERKCSIEPAALTEIVRRKEGDSWGLANELEKLCAYSTDTITAEDIRLLVTNAHDRDEWELSNALAQRDKRQAISALWKKIHDGTAEQLVAGSIAASLRNLLMIQDLSNRETPKQKIATMTGLHPFVISKTITGARMYDPTVLRTAHRKLARLDREFKNGKADLLDGLFSLLIGL